MKQGITINEILSIYITIHAEIQDRKTITVTNIQKSAWYYN